MRALGLGIRSADGGSFDENLKGFCSRLARDFLNCSRGEDGSFSDYCDFVSHKGGFKHVVCHFIDHKGFSVEYDDNFQNKVFGFENVSGIHGGNCKVKYIYKHSGLMTLEPSYDFGNNSWDVSLSRRFYEDDVVRASYESSSKVLELDWCMNTSMNDSFKVSRGSYSVRNIEGLSTIYTGLWSYPLC